MAVQANAQSLDLKGNVNMKLVSSFRQIINFSYRAKDADQNNRGARDIQLVAAVSFRRRPPVSCVQEVYLMLYKTV